jgi:integrase
MFSDFCVRYETHGKLHLKPSTWSVRKYQIEALKAAFGKDRLTEITAERIERYQEVRRKTGVRPVTVNNEIAVLHAILSYARSIGVPAAKPRTRMLKVRAAKRVRVWNEEQVERLYEAIGRISPDTLPMVVFIANTGCRRGEAARTWENVDLERRIVRIWPSDDWQPKDNEAREVPIGDALLPWLNAERRSPTWVFPCPRSGERYRCWPARKFDRARKAAGLEGGVHTLRHTYASIFLKTTPDLYLLARVLGHSDVRLTTRVYAHLLPDHLDRARNAVFLPAPVGPATTRAAKRWRVPATKKIVGPR